MQAQNDFYPSLADTAMGYAQVVKEEIVDLFAASADIVQLDEPYLQAQPKHWGQALHCHIYLSGHMYFDVALQDLSP